MPERSRSRFRSAPLAVTLIALGGLLAAAALLAGFTRHEIVDADRFADRAVEAAVDSPARQRLATELTNDLILRTDGELIAFRPLIEAATEGVIGSQPFRGVVRSSIADLHRTIVAGRSDTTTILLSDIGVLISAALQRTNPGVARQIPKGVDSGFSRDTIPDEILEQIDTATWLADRFYGLTAAALLLILAGVIAAPSRRRGISWAAMGIAGGGLLIVLVSVIIRQVDLGTTPDGLAADLLWPLLESLLETLLTWGIYLAGIGLITYAALVSLIRPGNLLAQFRSAWRKLSGPLESRFLETVRALLLIAAGALVILGRAWIWEVLLIIAGALLVLVGLERLFAAIDPEPQERTHPSDQAEKPKRRRRLLILGSAAGLVLLLTSGLFASGAVTSLTAVESTGCNGHDELCERPLNEVAFATTHNSMGGADIPDWMFAQQEKGLPGQLNDGIRGLMLDIHFGREVSDGVRTEMDRGKMNRELERLFGVQGAEAAERVRNRLIGGGQPGPKEVWLCHSVCEVGAMRFRKGLEQIRDFLATNPKEVIVLVIQDEDVPPAAVDQTFRQSGLLPYVSRANLSTGMPTLGEMIESDGRLLVFSENETSPAVPWLHPAFDFIKETPYHFTAAKQMSCKANRGPEDAPLFLINNWIDSSPAPRPSNARLVNSEEFLWNRVETCEAERGSFPNLIAVDFYREGDLFGVVDRLNGFP